MVLLGVGNLAGGMPARMGAGCFEQVINANLIDNFLNFKLNRFKISFRHSKVTSYVFPKIVKLVISFGFRVLSLL